MKQSNRSGVAQCAAIGVTLLLASPAWAQLSIALNPKPQYASDSCRSYGLALAIGTLPGTPFPVGTARDLRTSEKNIQARLEAIAKRKKDAKPGDHAVWQAAVAEMSSGKLELVMEYPKNLDAFYQRVRELTGVSNADTLGSLLTIAVGKTAVMTSVTRMGKDNYKSGHIVTLYGVASRPVTPTPLVVLNPAVKVANNTRLACEIDDVPNDEKWSAMASLEPSYELKSFGGSYLLMWLRKK